LENSVKYRLIVVTFGADVIAFHAKLSHFRGDRLDGPEMRFPISVKSFLASEFISPY